MLNVRDTLRTGSLPSAARADELQPDVAPPVPEQAAGKDMGAEAAGQPDMADRIRRAAQQRVELARLEVENRQTDIVSLEKRLAEAKLQNLPEAEIKADLDQAQLRLNDARNNHARAKEAQFNTELTINERPQVQAAHDHKPSIREQLKGLVNRSPQGLGSKTSIAPKFKK
jgi:hypothetical protein